MKEIFVLSWNIQKFGLQKAENNLASEVAKTISSQLEAKNRRKNFLGFLLEVVDNPESIAALRSALENELKSFSGKNVTVGIKKTGGNKNTKEIIMYFYCLDEDIEVKPRKFDLQTAIHPFIEEDKRRAEEEEKAHKLRTKGLRERRPLDLESELDLEGDLEKKEFEKILSRKKIKNKSNGAESYGSLESFMFRKNLSAKTEFRNGITLNLGIKMQYVKELQESRRLNRGKIRVTSIHLPGPNVVRNFPDIISALFSGLKKTKTDLAIGDLNYRGNLTEEDRFASHYVDKTLFSGGTTYKRGKLGTINSIDYSAVDPKRLQDLLGPHKWDRALHRPTPRSEASDAERFPARLFEMKPISDHVPISTTLVLKNFIQPIYRTDGGKVII